MRAVKSFLVFLGIVLFCAGSLRAQTANTTTSQTPGNAAQAAGGEEERYRIGYEDILEINVVKHPELRVKVSVGKNGTIFVPRIDEPVVAVCKTTQELANEITAAYKKDFLRDPFVSVEVAEQKSQWASVIGAVDKPGNIYLTRKVQLLQLISFAGGPNIHAGMRLMVFRAGNSSTCKRNEDLIANNDDNVELKELKLQDVMRGKETLWIQPGDVVSVLEADNVYVYGNVRKEGFVPMKEPITLMQALAYSQGIKSSTDKDKIRVLRQKDGSAERVEMIYDLNAIAKGRSQDPLLEPNDVVAVSEDKSKMILTKIANSATGGIPALFYRFPIQ
jgi:polysaccharide export outer membrane protein